MNTITLPCELVVNDLIFDVDLEVRYQQIEYTVIVNQVFINGDPVELSQDKLELIAEDIETLI